MQIFWTVYLFILGALFASFYNVMGIRISDGVSVLRRSHCPKCDNQLRFIDVIPLVGFIINRGKCHYCKEKIHIKYFLIEFVGGLLFMFSYLKYGFTFNLMEALLISSMLMIIVVTLYEHKRIYFETAYVFIPLLIVFDILSKNYYNLLSGLLAAILMSVLCAFNKNNLKYILIATACALTMNLYSFVFAIVITIIFKIIEKIVKKEINYIYIFSLCVLISLFFGDYLVR